MAIAPRFIDANPFSEGLAAVETSARLEGIYVVDIAWGFIDKTGALKIPDKYDYARSFSGGLAVVAIKMGVSEGYVDHDGKMVIPARFEQAQDFSEGLAVVSSDGWSYIERTGKSILTNRNIAWPFADGLAVSGSWESPNYIDQNGRVIAPYSTNK